MQNTSILFPILAMVLLTALVLLALGRGRIGAIRRARVSPQRVATPEGQAQIFQGLENVSDNFENLFEAPVLFYIAAILIHVQKLTDTGFLALAWAYVALRYVHSFIHCTSNNVRQRFLVYLLSMIALWATWIRLATFLISNR